MGVTNYLLDGVILQKAARHPQCHPPQDIAGLIKGLFTFAMIVRLLDFYGKLEGWFVFNGAVPMTFQALQKSGVHGLLLMSCFFCPW